MEKSSSEASEPALWIREIAGELEVFDNQHPVLPLAPDLPPWVQNVLGELLKSFYPKQGLTPNTAVSLGVLLGRHYALHAMLFTGDLPLGPKTEEELLHLLERLEGRQTEIAPEELDAKTEIIESYGPNFRNLVSRAFAKALEQPAPEALAFVHGFAKASRLKPDSLASDYKMTHSLRLYFFLFRFWPLVERFGSIAHLHRELTKVLKHRAGNLKSFEKLCQRVGLKLRDPGRPSK